MQQQVAVVTLGVGDLPSAKRFYRNGFGWCSHVSTASWQQADCCFGTVMRPSMEAFVATSKPLIRLLGRLLGIQRGRLTTKVTSLLQPDRGI